MFFSRAVLTSLTFSWIFSPSECQASVSVKAVRSGTEAKIFSFSISMYSSRLRISSFLLFSLMMPSREKEMIESLSACRAPKNSCSMPSSFWPSSMSAWLSILEYLVKELALEHAPRYQLAIHVIGPRLYGLLHLATLSSFTVGNRLLLPFQSLTSSFQPDSSTLSDTFYRPIRRRLGGVCLGLGRGGSGKVLQQL